MKTRIIAIVSLFFVLFAAPSQGADKKDDFLLFSDALARVNQDLTGISIDENQVVLIENLKQWLKDSGRREKLSDLQNKNAFVFPRASGGNKPPPYFPIFFRLDTKFWKDAKDLSDRERPVAVVATASIIVHEFCHVMGQPDEDTCRGIEIQYLEGLQVSGQFVGKAAEAYLKNVRATLTEEQQKRKRIALR